MLKNKPWKYHPGASHPDLLHHSSLCVTLHMSLPLPPPAQSVCQAEALQAPKWQRNRKLWPFLGFPHQQPRWWDRRDCSRGEKSKDVGTHAGLNCIDYDSANDLKTQMKSCSLYWMSRWIPLFCRHDTASTPSSSNSCRHFICMLLTEIASNLPD